MAWREQAWRQVAAPLYRLYSHTYGETLEEARAVAVEAVEAYLESLQMDDEPSPEDDVVEPSPLVEAVRVRLGRG